MAYPKSYEFYRTLESLDGIEDYYLIQDSNELAELLDNIGLYPEWKKDITAAVVVIEYGNYNAIWLSEDSAWYNLSAIYRPLPFYKSDQQIDMINLPVYWSEFNEYYSR